MRLNGNLHTVASAQVSHVFSIFLARQEPDEQADARLPTKRNLQKNCRTVRKWMTNSAF